MLHLTSRMSKYAVHKNRLLCHSQMIYRPYLFQGPLDASFRTRHGTTFRPFTTKNSDDEGKKDKQSKVKDPRSEERGGDDGRID